MSGSVSRFDSYHCVADRLHIVHAAPLPLVIRESSEKEELICGSGWNADGRGCMGHIL
jgi:hypothetical protein